MKKKMREFLNEGINLDKLSSIFYFIHEITGSKELKYMEFIQSLNLTEEQYRRLASIIEDYGSTKYDDGRDGHFYDEPCEY